MEKQKRIGILCASDTELEPFFMPTGDFMRQPRSMPENQIFPSGLELWSLGSSLSEMKRGRRSTRNTRRSIWGLKILSRIARRLPNGLLKL